MKYKVGDKVRIKSLDWYNTFKDEDGVVDCGQWCFDKKMSRFCGKIVTICESDDMFKWYRIREENNSHIRYNNNMIEGFADVEPQEKMVSLDKVCEYLQKNMYVEHIFEYSEDEQPVQYVCASVSDSVEEFVNNFRKAMEE